MSTTVKKQTAFRFDENLLKRLKINAKKEHRSLNNYVEVILTEIVFHEPNEDTLAAMEEAKNTENLETLDVENLKELVESI